MESKSRNSPAPAVWIDVGVRQRLGLLRAPVSEQLGGSPLQGSTWLWCLSRCWCCLIRTASILKKSSEVNSDVCCALAVLTESGSLQRAALAHRSFSGLHLADLGCRGQTQSRFWHASFKGFNPVLCLRWEFLSCSYTKMSLKFSLQPLGQVPFSGVGNYISPVSRGLTFHLTW